MKKFRIGLSVLLVVVLGFGAYVRLAPVDPARWHKPSYPVGPGNYDSAGGFQAVRSTERAPDELLAAANAIILATPRTQLIAGSIEDGMITYETRSQIWGFPDYTTVHVTSGEIAIFGRLRFGQSDLGVNKARILGWLDQLDLGS